MDSEDTLALAGKVEVISASLNKLRSEAPLSGAQAEIVDYVLAELAALKAEFPAPAVTHQQSLLGRNDSLRSAYDESPLCLALYDVSGNMIAVNKTCVEVFKIPNAALAKAPPLLEDPSLPEHAKADLRSGRSTRFHGCLHPERTESSGLYCMNLAGPMEIEVVISPLVSRDGKQAGFMMQAQDVTPLKHAHKRLEEAYAEEVKLRRDLEAEMTKRIEFTKAIAHELKTPLTSILASSTALAANLREGLPLDFARNLVRGAYRLSNTVNELLDLANGELGLLTLVPRAMDPARLLQDVSVELGPTATSLGLSLVSHIDPLPTTIRADEERLRQVLANLITNAFRYTPRGGKIELKAHVQGSTLVVEVIDNGRGILAEGQGEGLPAYRFPEEGDKRSGGFQLGFSVSKLLIELHGGQVWAERQGSYNIVGFWLPLEPRS